MELRGIDFHVHPCDPRIARAWAGDPADYERFFRGSVLDEPTDAMAERFRGLGLMGVLLGADAETTTGIEPYPNDELAATCRAHPNLFVGFAGIDPWKGQAAIRELERCVRDLGLRGAKFHPGRQRFVPGDPRFDPLFEAASELGAICLFHTGMMAAGAGTPGGRGERLEYTRPIHLDALAARFPRLTIVAAHPAWPWHEELLAVARHKVNVYMDLSGYLPRYIPESVIKMATGLLQDQALFGSDYPFITPERWLADFDTLDVKDAVREKLLLGNATRLLGLR
ncbi:MAG: amidohydrolase family protein [Chloroflexota bacterium]|nr:amidohydrolase family protein [Chloroflexota bacterium]